MNFPLERFLQLKTPFYYYDMDLLKATLVRLRDSLPDERFIVHYAIKACSTEPVVKQIASFGIGADCVSGGEVEASINAGISPDKIVFAGVAKADWEILVGLRNNIFCFNVESEEELVNINTLAQQEGVTARVCLRINPDIDPHTHKNISTGLAEDKFGIQIEDLESTLHMFDSLGNLHFLGLHFHIGSQLLDMEPYRQLAQKVNEVVCQTEKLGYAVKVINVGGGLGINYHEPDKEPIADFKTYFGIFKDIIRLRDDQTLHFELGRAIVAQCGSLITRVLYNKHSHTREYVMADAGMNDLIRPALYEAYHSIDNLSNDEPKTHRYDVVGPVCESSDVFQRDYLMPLTRRGDLLAIRSAGAYGETMASRYNLRPLPQHYTSEELKKHYTSEELKG